MDLRKLSIPLCAIALAACGGGGGDTVDTPPGNDTVTTGTVARILADATELHAFVGDKKSLTVKALDAAGRTITAPSVTWTSSDSAIARLPETTPTKATLETPGIGKATVKAAANSQSVEVPVTVYATPKTVDDLKQVFPFKKTSSTVSTYSDVSESGNNELFDHMTALFELMKGGSTLLPANGAPTSAEFYLTRDVNVLRNGQLEGDDGKPLCEQKFEGKGEIGEIMLCPTSGAEIDRWFYVGGPNATFAENKAQLQQALATVFFTRATNEEEFAWLYKAVSHYFESGSLNGQTFTVRVADLKARMAIDPATRFVPPDAEVKASTMIKAIYRGSNQTAPIHAYSYGPTAVLLFLEEKYPGKAKALIGRLPDSESPKQQLPEITTNAAALTELLKSLGPLTETDLDTAFTEWRKTNGL